MEPHTTLSPLPGIEYGVPSTVGWEALAALVVIAVVLTLALLIRRYL